MRTTIAAGLSLLAGLTTAAPVNQVTRLDTLAKRNFAADVISKLSTGATVTFPQDSEWKNITTRWDDFLAPTFQAAVQVSNEADIVAVVKYATAHNISFFTQGGGHGFAPLNTVQDAIMIQMRNLNHINIDSTTGIATVGGGTEYIEFIDAAYAAQREYPVGSCPCVGFTGAGMGGGIGRLQGLHGLSVDAFRRLRVVLASGEAINVSSTENSDLFWAMQGAGHNFGVVVETEVQTYAQPSGGMYYNVDLTLSDDKLEAGLKVMNEQIVNMPAELAVEPAFLVDPTTLKPFFTVNIVYSGSEADGRKFSDPWKALGPLNFTESMVSWKDLPTKTEGGAKNVDCLNGGYKDIVSSNLKSFDIPTMVSLYKGLGDFVQANPNANASSILFEVYSQKGVQARPAADTAVAGRDFMNILPLAFAWWTDVSVTKNAQAWLKDVQEQMTKTNGYDNLYLYQNYANDEPAEAYYGYESWRIERLQDLKKKYDPTNQFFGYHPIPK